MIQLKIAVLDEEEEYLEQLSAYFIQKKEHFFKLWTFSEQETFYQTAETVTFDVLLVTEQFFREIPKEEQQTKIILFYEDGVPEYALGVPTILKYQSADRIFAQISSLFWQEAEPQEPLYPAAAAELIGVYSPIHCENQMLFSMTMAQILGEHQKVLYLNLLEHSGFYSLADVQAEEDVGDLLYGMMQPEHDFAAGLHRIRRTFLNFDYIPPAVNPEHLSEISKTLYEQLFLELKNQSGYDVIILDFGTVFLGFAEMLPILGSLYCLEKEGGMNRYRTEEFLEYLKKESEHAMSHIKNVHLPKTLMCAEGEHYMEQSMYGGMGDYIRRCLLGGVEIG